MQITNKSDLQFEKQQVKDGEDDCNFNLRKAPELFLPSWSWVSLMI